MPAVKIYRIPTVVDLTLIDHGVRNNNMPFNDSDFRVYKNTFNPIEFVLRDNDRKPVSLVCRNIVITVINFFNQEIMLQKEAEIIDEHKGKFRVTFEPQETVGWKSGFYKYSLRIDIEDGSNNLLYVDQNQNAAGYFEFIDGVLPELVESVKVMGSDFTPVNISPPTTEPTIYISSAYPGDSFYSQHDGLHTAVVYATNYAGKFYIQGSLEESPTSLDKDWFDIYLTGFTPYYEFGNTPHPDSTFTGLEAFNFTANVLWVRFKHIPDEDNPGAIDQILYRH